jgi:glycosyltransferase involved in cell wall biosynthesis
LKDAGLSIELNIVGCFPPVALPDFVKIRGFISKADQAGRDILDSLFAKSHFLIFPSRAECYGLVSAEANAYGVPAIASDRGGIPTVVKDGVNGRIFSLEEYVDKATKFIIEHMNDHLKYALLCQNAYYEFLRRLNWRAAGTELMCLLRNL